MSLFACVILLWIHQQSKGWNASVLAILMLILATCYRPFGFSMLAARKRNGEIRRNCGCGLQVYLAMILLTVFEFRSVVRVPSVFSRRGPKNFESLILVRHNQKSSRSLI